MSAKPKITCLGGGHAMPKAVLAGLKKHPVEISVICAMLDSGGSSGRLRKDYGIVAPGDIRRAFLALADTSPVMGELLNYRFETGELAGHSFANLLITALELSTNDYTKALGFLRKVLKIKHQVLPVTLDWSDLCAVLENNQVIKGEANIDRPEHNPSLKIKKVYLEPEAQAYGPAIKAIEEADLIVVGPGDLYSSLAQILLVKGVASAILQSRAKKAYVCNLMTKRGETNNFSVLDFTKEMEALLASQFDYIVYNNFSPSTKRIGNHRKKWPELLKMVDINNGLGKPKFLGQNLILDKGPIEHDPQKVSKILLSLI
jgi:uncharacterized cofD-like protein